MKLSSVIKKIREEKKCTQSELAYMLGITQQAVAKYEKDMTKNISPSLAMAIEQATNGSVTRDELLFPELYSSKTAHHGQDNTI
jgi:transcriptional regulator with XRE-family HTH domain